MQGLAGESCLGQNTGEIGASKRDLTRLKQLAASRYKNGKPLSEDPRFQARVSRVEVELMALEVTNLRFLDQIQRGRELGAEVSLLKVRGTEIQQALTELMLDVAGPLAAQPIPCQTWISTHIQQIWPNAIVTTARRRFMLARMRSSAMSLPRCRLVYRQDKWL